MDDHYGDYKWRVGSKLGRTIYAVVDSQEGSDNCDIVLGMVDTREIAEHIVYIHNIYAGFEEVPENNDSSLGP